MKRATNRTCPRCGGGVPSNEHRGEFMGAMSRKDNDTEVCSNCGVDEAMRQVQGLDPWPGYPDLMDGTVMDWNRVMPRQE